MANYNYVIDSSFRPFSMQEMLTPLVLYKDAYEKQEAAYDAMAQKADKFKYLESKLADDPESESAQIYQAFKNDLQKYGDDFGKNGLTINNRRGFADLRRRYLGEIGRLEAVNDLKQNQIKEQSALRQKDPTLLLSRRAENTSFDDYLHNPDLSYESYSGALLAKQVHDAVSNLSKVLRDHSNGKILDSHTKTWLQEHGFTPAEVMTAILYPNANNSSVLNSIVENVVNGSGIKSWADRRTLEQAYNYARQGLWNAIGEDRVATYTVPKQSGSVVAPTPAPTIPNLLPEIPTKKEETKKPSNSTPASRGQHRGRMFGNNKKAYGGHIYAPGGPIETNEEDISPYLQSVIDQMDDDTYREFITKGANTETPTAEQEDSVLRAYDNQIAYNAQAALAQKIYEENHPATQTRDFQGTYRNVYTTKEEEDRLYNKKMFEKYGKYFYKTPNGNYAINKEGRKKYESDMAWFGNPNRYAGMPYAPGGIVPVSKEEMEAFGPWIKSLGLSEMAHGRNGKWQNEKFKEVVANVKGNYDATRATEYTEAVDHNDLENLMGAIYNIATDGTIPKFTRVKDGNTYIVKEDSKHPINLEDIDKEGVKTANKVFGIHGNFIEVTTKKGKKFIVPFRYIDPYRDDLVTSAVKKAYALKKLQDAGNIFSSHGKEIDLTMDDMMKALNAANFNMTNAYNFSKTKATQVEDSTHR